MKKILLCFVVGMLCLSGCSSKGNDVDVKKAVSTVLESKADELPATMEVDDQVLKDLFQIDVADVEQYAIAIPMMNVQATEIIMIEAKDGKKDVIKKALDQRMKTNEDTWSTYLPDQYELVKNRQEYESGNYFIIVIAEKAEDIMKELKKDF
ncbi:MAG: DUF4358 domain-containing protein [Longicatena sp.]